MTSSRSIWLGWFSWKQQNGNVSWRLERARNGPNETSGAQLACEQALLFGRVKRVSRERENARASGEAAWGAFSRGSLRLPKSQASAQFAALNLSRRYNNKKHVNNSYKLFNNKKQAPHSPVQTDATLLGVTCCVRFHTLLHAVARSEVWDRSNFWANNSQHFFWSVIVEA